MQKGVFQVMIITDENMHEFKQGDIVEYDIHPTVKGIGRIVGRAVEPQPIMGRGYIIESADGQFPSEFYPFSCLICYESWITNHPNKDKKIALY